MNRPLHAVVDWFVFRAVWIGCLLASWALVALAVVGIAAAIWVIVAAITTNI